MMHAGFRPVSFLTLAAFAAGCSAGTRGNSSSEEAIALGATPVQSQSALGTSRVQTKEEWRRQMSKTPPPKEGCFDAVHPNMRWVEVPCATGKHAIPPHVRPVAQASATAEAPEVAVARSRRVRPMTSATVTSGTISWAEGSFPSVTVTGENENGTSNDFSLQLNTNPDLRSSAISALCGIDASPSPCTGWVQFVYWEGAAEIWYVLLGARGICPSSSWSTDASGNCYLEAPNRSAIPAQAISNLANMSVTGVAGGTTDTVTVATGSDHVYAATNTSLFDLAPGWTSADFNVLGNDSYGAATFDGGTTLAVQLLTDTGNTSAPICDPSASTTGESNSLTFVPGSCCTFGTPIPGIQFTESNVSSATAFPCPAGSCGEVNEPCCAGSRCNSGLGCYPTPGSTESSCLPAPPPPCGRRGEACCEGTRCGSGLQCKPFSVTVDGHRLTTFKCE